MAEWFKAVDLKSIDGNASASSNLACRVILKIKYYEVSQMKTNEWISVKTSLPPKERRNGPVVMSFGFMTQNADSVKVILTTTINGAMGTNVGT